MCSLSRRLRRAVSGYAVGCASDRRRREGREGCRHASCQGATSSPRASESAFESRATCRVSGGQTARLGRLESASRWRSPTVVPARPA
ncbi:uncharacterized protein SCHCODRAFT_02115295 [Schizophyllum commune H4-8]|uniref:uncharacterized protein n=1 Tax=Schizophyllum commune (strain H4-8 / FGSC 9210) TaxID=578458 RepID=UPI00215EEFBD|nr:uncharacterized protein SCHCODRAFT_02115160 [Schizophyllum commune H4-8]XP_050197511.1 uncharacterized protein SCHCODRAFT_02115295 [Schizophyllum commune H4-8]KAI5886169.1 hypothetical protein SCHCODRAFT_02115160 [Schizophyllum commune H4-8]KAI5886176.1 hypothetical protein SCHCODRAFT_02115295 [Schizophyllum commune H4-8]